jgi:hypothetical protein
MASEFPEYPSVKIEYHVVTPRGRIAYISNDLGLAENHWKKSNHPDWKLVRVTTTQHDCTPLTAEEIDHHIDHIWSLEQYINWLNKDQEFPLLSENLSYWAEYNITTPRQLADYLDACVEKEVGDPALLERV